MYCEKRNSEAGFTLIEMLIALALTAVIAALLMSAISSARQTLASVGRHGDDAEISATQAFMRRLISEARAAADPEERGREFIGAPNSLEFISSFTPRGQYGGLWSYRIALEADDASAVANRFVIHQRLVRPPASQIEDRPQESEIRTNLLTGVKTVTVRYFGAPDEASQPQWQDQWQSLSRLPQLISMELDFAESGQRHWTKLIVAPALTQ